MYVAPPGGRLSRGSGRESGRPAVRVPERHQDSGAGAAAARLGPETARVGFLGSFTSALVAALWTWGTPQSWGFLTLASVTHVASVTDVLRQGSFPVYPARRAMVLVTLSLGLVFYLPLVAALTVLAWPGLEPANTGNGFLVNRYAYREKGPSQGQWIWMHAPVAGEPRAARVLAISGQEVEWTGTNWMVDGNKRSLHSPGRLTSWPQACRFKIPPNQVLVEPRDDGVSTVPIGSVVLVSHAHHRSGLGAVLPRLGSPLALRNWSGITSRARGYAAQPKHLVPTLRVGTVVVPLRGAPGSGKLFPTCPKSVDFDRTRLLPGLILPA